MRNDLQKCTIGSKIGNGICNKLGLATNVKDTAQSNKTLDKTEMHLQCLISCY